MNTFKKILKYFAFALSALFVLTVVFYFTLPDGTEFARKNPKSTSLMIQQEKEAKKKDKKLGRYWIWVPLSQMSGNLLHAVIISEDARFYSHPGFDVEAIKFAAEKNLKKRRFAVGGSTITQQLAKNLYLSSRKSLFRKLEEIVIAYKMDKKLTKYRILEMYLNVIEFGHGIYGAEAAARHYYGKSALWLSVDEACRLAVILPSPLRHSPYDGSRLVERRRLRLLKWEFKTGRIDENTYEVLTGIRIEYPIDSTNVADSLVAGVDSTSMKLSRKSDVDMPLSVERLYVEPLDVKNDTTKSR